jgi:hypothetical protein
MHVTGVLPHVDADGKRPVGPVYAAVGVRDRGRILEYVPGV